MAIKPFQLRRLITDVLKSVNLYSMDAVELLMLTSAQESHCGTYIEQINGPALGIFQMEPGTEWDVWFNVLKYKKKLKKKVNSFLIQHEYNSRLHNLNLRANLPYQIIMARMLYLRFSEPLPIHTDVLGMAKYYKKYWNTELGKATVQEAVNNYLKYGA